MMSRIPGVPQFAKQLRELLPTGHLQAIMRHKHIKTTAEVYMDHIPESVRKALDARTDAKRKRKSPGVLLNIAGQSKTKPSVT